MILDITKQRVIIPAGKCPIPLEEVSVDSVLNWVEKIDSKRPDKIYCSTAYRYWIRQILFHEPEEMKKAIDIINEFIDDKNVFFEMKNSR
tara:strand:- start:660 stop:929 length:270 start_codon:yes stop_codon:yes gene_type:complete